MSEPFMPTVVLSPDQLVKVEGGEVITWAEAIKRLSAPAPQGIGREEIARVIVDGTGVGTLGLTHEASMNAALDLADALLALLPTEPPTQGEG